VIRLAARRDRRLTPRCVRASSDARPSHARSHTSNRALLERAADAPHTIKPDRLSRSKKSLKLQAVGAEGALTDGTRTIKLYTMTRFDHTEDMLLVYLPKERILAEADA
jgi:hypothetical protein